MMDDLRYFFLLFFLFFSFFYGGGGLSSSRWLFGTQLVGGSRSEVGGPERAQRLSVSAASVFGSQQSQLPTHIASECGG